MIIRGQQQLTERYGELTAGDVFVGQLPVGTLKQAILVHLLETGVVCLPSVLSQTLNRSKAFQAWVYRKQMVAHTAVVSRRADLIRVINRYHRHEIGTVVTKDDRRHCGHGIRCWVSAEMVYNTLAFDKASYPFVIQPYLAEFVDLRVIIVGDYVEAYTRHNPHNFRQNIAAGGRSAPFEVTPQLETLCRRMMAAGKFPYAHIDLQMTPDGSLYLSEIALEGGIKGARIDRPALTEIKRRRLDSLLPDDSSGAATDHS